MLYRFPSNGGLTRSWNRGIEIARERGYEYVACGNSDLLFGGEWPAAMFKAVDRRKYAFVGPVTNAPGDQPRQDVRRYALASGFNPETHDQQFLDAMGRRMFLDYGGRVDPFNPNGFFLFGRTESWVTYAHDAESHRYFPPSIDVMPSGRRNPTPLMTGQEDWLNARVRSLGGRVGFCPGSYVFHFRSVTRGKAYAKGQAVRA
jgi:GT2 family glycosyltransferase